MTPACCVLLLWAFFFSLEFQTTGGCRADVELTVWVVAFRAPPCPADVFVFVGEPQSMAKATWAVPKLSNRFGHLGVRASASPGDQFVYGATEVTYTTDALRPGEVLVCSFTVFVRVGANVNVTSVGHMFGPPTGGPDSGFLHDVLVDSTLSLGGGANAPTLQINPREGVTLALDPPAGQMFSVVLPAGSSAVVRVYLRWCSSGAITAADRLVNATTGLVFEGLVGLAADTIRITSGNASAFVASGRCFSMEASTTAISQVFYYVLLSHSNRGREKNGERNE
mgnify:CR=1 FL=1